MSVHPVPLPDLVDRCGRVASEGRRLRPDCTPLAAFDADGTLWRPDVAHLLWERLVRRRALHPRAAAPLARALRQCGREPVRDPYVDFSRLAELHRGGLCPEEVLIRAMLEGLVGLPEEELYTHAVAAVTGSKQLRSLGTGPSSSVLSSLRSQGFRVIVVSASPRWAVEAAAGRLGIEPRDVIAGEVAVVHGVLQDSALEPLPHGRGKIEAILRRHGSVPSIAFGNALGDLPMLEAASHLRLLVNPSDDLVAACERRGGVAWSTRLEDTPRP